MYSAKTYAVPLSGSMSHMPSTLISTTSEGTFDRNWRRHSPRLDGTLSDSFAVTTTLEGVDLES